MSVGQRHRLVADQVQQLTVPYGHLAVWALGQHGFLLKGGRTTVIVDPYLSDSIAERGGHFRDTFARLIPIVVAPQALSIVDMVLVTHHHTDHCDPETLVPLLAASTARLLTSYKAYERLRELGIDLTRVEVPPVDQALMYNDELIVTPVPAAHYDHDPDAHGNPAYLGFIITLNGVTLYHSGDTVIYPGLMERLQAQRIDMMCLPINGRDWVREQQGLVGNMDYREAVELTVRVGAQVLLPAHNDLFRVNCINPAYLLDYLVTNHPRQRVHFLQAGELYYYVA